MEKGHRRIRSMGLLGVILPVVLFVCPCTLALNPALDLSQYAHTTWKVRDGFSKGPIYSIAQTPDGYLWLGTEFGLLRFDGVKSKNWQPPGDQHLPPGTVRSLLVARDGTLWIGVDKGLSSWKDGKLTQYPELAGLYIFDLLEDGDGTVWVGGAAAPTGRLCAIQHGVPRCYGEDGSLGRGVARLYQDRSGNLWAGVEGGLWRWKPGLPQFYRLQGEPNGITGVEEDASGALLVSWMGELHRFRDGKIEPYPLPSGAPRFRVTTMFRERDGSLWIATINNGLVHLHEDRLDVFTQSDGLTGDLVNCVFQDREGSIWVGTANGLDRFREFAVPTSSVKQGLSNAVVESVLADEDGSLWLATPGGLNRWENGHFVVPRIGGARRAGMLNGDVPNSLFRDTDGTIWVSTFHDFGHLTNGQFVRVGDLPPGLVLSIAKDDSGSFWLAKEPTGLFQVRDDRVVQRIPWSAFGHQDHASVLASDPSRRGLWIGFFLGGMVYFQNGRVLGSFSPADGLGSGRVSHLFFDQQGTLWASTEGGLSRLKNGRVATLTSKNGLPCDTVHWTTESDRSFWLYTSCGLLRIARSELDAWASTIEKDHNSKQTVQFTLFDSLDGVRILGAPGHFSPQVAKSPDGRLWFLPLDGVSVLDPPHIPFNKIPPPVHIEQLTVDRKAYDTTSAANQPVRLPSLVRDVEIDYTALSLVAPEKIRFRYMLEGLDSDWQEAGNRRQAFYTNLAPRQYRFRVAACNNSGVWNETGTFVDFSVAPAYYQTAWFRMSCAIGFLVLLWGLYQLRLRQLAREYHMRLEERVGERTRIARELHDSLLQGFQGLMFRLQAVRDLLPTRASEAVKALDVALERGDKAILEGRDAVADLRESIVGDNDIPRALTALGEELVLQNNDGATPPCIRVLVEGKQRELDPQLRDEIYRIAREALRNAFRHARAQKIETEINYSPSQFVLRVRDDGNGIDPAVANQGARAGHWGLPGMRERAEKFGGQLEVWSEQGAGTEIALTIPASVAYAEFNRGSGIRFLRSKKMGQSKHEN